MRRVLIFLAVLVSLAGIVIGVFFTGLEESDVWWPLAWVMWTPVGALILLRRPENGVGRTQLVIGLAWGLSFVGMAIAQNATALGLRVWGEWLSLVLGVTPWLGIVWLMLIFPTGHLLRRVERLTGAGVVGLGIVATLAFSFSSVPMELTSEPSPLALPQLDMATQWIVSDSGFAIVLVLVFAAIVSLLTRWRASTGVERHQYRWLLLGAMFFAVTMGVGQVVPEDNRFLFLWVAAGAAIPTAIGVAVLRYRLYEIDRIVSRTLAYLAVVVVLGSLFALGVVAVPNLVIGTGSAPPLVVAASTLLVAAMFNPLRLRVLRWVDRRFNRSRYDAERVMDEFAESLRDRVDANGLLDGWVGVVSETMVPSGVAVWVRE